VPDSQQRSGPSLQGPFISPTAETDIAAFSQNGRLLLGADPHVAQFDHRSDEKLHSEYYV